MVFFNIGQPYFAAWGYMPVTVIKHTKQHFTDLYKLNYCNTGSKKAEKSK